MMLSHGVAASARNAVGAEARGRKDGPDAGNATNATHETLLQAGSGAWAGCLVLVLGSCGFFISSHRATH